LKQRSKSYKIAIIGPESTGKSVLSEQLAKHFGGVFYPEIARDYISSLARNYTINDIDAILEMQKNQYFESINDTNPYQFFDTEWIITKIWYEWVYKVLPINFSEVIDQLEYDFYLLCAPDIAWIPDSVRENGGDARKQLFSVYEEELQFFNRPYGIVQGYGESRTQSAILIVNEFIHR